MKENYQLTEKLKNGTPEIKIENEIQLYRTRWLILAIFVVYAIAAGVQWMQYSIIANFVMRFYGVEAYEVEWTTMLHMLTYVIFIFPALWFLEYAVSTRIETRRLWGIIQKILDISSARTNEHPVFPITGKK